MDGLIVDLICAFENDLMVSAICLKQNDELQIVYLFQTPSVTLCIFQNGTEVVIVNNWQILLFCQLTVYSSKTIYNNI